MDEKTYVCAYKFVSRIRSALEERAQIFILRAVLFNRAMFILISNHQLARETLYPRFRVVTFDIQ